MQEIEPSPTAPVASESHAAESVEIPAEEWIYREGDTGSDLFIIDDGEVDLLLHDADGDRVVAHLGPGDFFGETGACGESRRRDSALARSACRLLPIGRDLFPEVLRAEPGIAMVMLERLSFIVREFRATAMASPAPEAGSQPVEADSTIEASLVHDDSGQRFVVAAGEETTLGRSGSAVEPDIDLSDLDPHSTVSRAHAAILSKPGGLCVIERKPSTNGTFVDGERISANIEVPLPPGCKLMVGSVQMTLECG